MRKTLTAALCAALLVAAPAAAGAQTGSLGSLTGGSSSSNPFEDSRVAALREAGISYNESLGHRQNAEAQRHANTILSQAMRGEFVYVNIPFDNGHISRSVVRNSDGAGFAYKLSESIVDTFLEVYEDSDVPASVSAPFGVAVARDGNTFYLVEYFLGV